MPWWSALACAWGMMLVTHWNGVNLSGTRRKVSWGILWSLAYGTVVGGIAHGDAHGWVLIIIVGFLLNIELSLLYPQNYREF